MSNFFSNTIDKVETLAKDPYVEAAAGATVVLAGAAAAIYFTKGAALEEAAVASRGMITGSADEGLLASIRAAAKGGMNPASEDLLSRSVPIGKDVGRKAVQSGGEIITGNGSPLNFHAHTHFSDGLNSVLSIADHGEPSMEILSGSNWGPKATVRNIEGGVLHSKGSPITGRIGLAGDEDLLSLLRSDKVTGRVVPSNGLKGPVGDCDLLSEIRAAAKDSDKISLFAEGKPVKGAGPIDPRGAKEGWITSPNSGKKSVVFNHETDLAGPAGQGSYSFTPASDLHSAPTNVNIHTKVDLTAVPGFGTTPLRNLDYMRPRVDLAALTGLDVSRLGKFELESMIVTERTVTAPLVVKAGVGATILGLAAAKKAQ